MYISAIFLSFRLRSRYVLATSALALPWEASVSYTHLDVYKRQDYNGTIYFSARSIDEVNVQVMMEKLGGGGHRPIAGAQMTVSYTHLDVYKRQSPLWLKGIR